MRSLLVALALYLAGAAALFAWAFSIPAADDYAGWIIAVVAAQLLALPALLGRGDATLSHARAASLAVPAGLATAFAAGAVAIVLLAGRRLDGFEVLLVASGGGLGALVVAVLAYWRALRRAPAAAAVRRVLATTTAAGVAAALATLPWWRAVASARGLELDLAIGGLVLGGVPLAWVAAPWALVVARRR